MLSAKALHDTKPPVSETPPELSILLVEDSLPLQSRLKEYLTATAESEQEANRPIDKGLLDVMVIDVELRPGSG